MYDHATPVWFCETCEIGDCDAHVHTQTCRTHEKKENKNINIFISIFLTCKCRPILTHINNEINILFKTKLINESNRKTQHGCGARQIEILLWNFHKQTDWTYLVQCACNVLFARWFVKWVKWIYIYTYSGPASKEKPINNQSSKLNEQTRQIRSHSHLRKTNDAVRQSCVDERNNLQHRVYQSAQYLKAHRTGQRVSRPCPTWASAGCRLRISGWPAWRTAGRRAAGWAAGGGCRSCWPTSAPLPAARWSCSEAAAAAGSCCGSCRCWTSLRKWAHFLFGRRRKKRMKRHLVPGGWAGSGALVPQSARCCAARAARPAGRGRAPASPRPRWRTRWTRTAARCSSSAACGRCAAKCPRRARCRILQSPNHFTYIDIGTCVTVTHRKRTATARPWWRRAGSCARRPAARWNSGGAAGTTAAAAATVYCSSPQQETPSAAAAWRAARSRWRPWARRSASGAARRAGSWRAAEHPRWSSAAENDCNFVPLMS